MNNLSNSILTYYWQNFESLPYDKQFHFASRLYLWSQDHTAQQYLFGSLRDEFTAQENPYQAFEAIAERIRNEVSHGAKNAAALRQPYFERYPKLKLYVSLLFRLLFLETIYGLDGRSDLYRLVSDDELADYEARLLQDSEAIAILSTHAINFLYLYRRILKRDNDSLDPQLFLQIGQQHYDRSQPIHLQLLIYLYTHCIIGESKFYYRSPVNAGDAYLTMLHELEALLSESFESINLDNKFEYLACCRLMGLTSPLESRIWDEAQHSLSEEGTFLIDRHNHNPQRTNTSLDLSEHRNVLCILADQPFKPLAAA